MIKISEARDELNDLENEPEEQRDEDRYKELVALFEALGSEDAEFLYENDREWEDYCAEYVEDWLMNAPDALKACIDWKRWADTMLADHTMIQVGDTCYILV